MSAMSHLAITSRVTRRKSVGSKASPTSTQWLASEESAGYHQATSGVVARLKVVARRPALRPVHHAQLDAASDTALQLRQTSLTQELAADGKTFMRNSHRFDLIEATWVTKKDQKGKTLFPKKVESNNAFP